MPYGGVCRRIAKTDRAYILSEVWYSTCEPVLQSE